MTWVVQRLTDSEWADVTDKSGDKREFEDPAIANDWILGMQFLDAGTYRAVEKDPPIPRDQLFKPGAARKLILEILQKTPMCDADLLAEMKQRHEHDDESPLISPQGVRSVRLRMQRRGLIRPSGEYKVLPSGFPSTVWEVENDDEDEHGRQRDVPAADGQGEVPPQ